ncbi:MAG: hypothetical protein BECKG1743E_GA0114224_101781, partial [Candidatus Kentron sp. G]
GVAVSHKWYPNLGAAVLVQLRLNSDTPYRIAPRAATFGHKGEYKIRPYVRRIVRANLVFAPKHSRIRVTL